MMMFPMTLRSFRLKFQLHSTAHNASLVGHGYFLSLVPPYVLTSSPQICLHVVPHLETPFLSLTLTYHLWFPTQVTMPKRAFPVL